MNNWFTVERIDMDTYVISEYKHWEETHCCFYEPERRYLYSGDLIYLGCLDAFYPTTDPIQFYQSVKRVETLTVERVLPAHHQLAIPIDIVSKVSKAFGKIEKDGQLTQGAGLFDFGDFQIHI